MKKSTFQKGKKYIMPVMDVAVNSAWNIIRIVFRVLITIILIALTAGLLFTCIFAYYIKTSLSSDLNITLTDYTLSLSSTVWTSTLKEDGTVEKGTELALLESTEDRLWIDYKDIPENLEHAAVAIEDKRFYEHKGVDWYRTVGAFVNMFVGMKNDFGGSTITQQLIKNVTEQDDVTVQRKLMEIFRAMELEKSYTKQEIIEWYLNAVYFGEGAYGVGAAADTYFGKDVSELTLAECASIIGITNNPSLYDPFISQEKNKQRQEDILFQMYDQGYITQEEYISAKAEELHFVRGESDSYVQEIYSYYVEVVIQDVINDMVSELGLSSKAASQLLYHGGYQIYSCIDPEIQRTVDELYSNLDALPQAYRASSQQLQSAIVIMDPYTGDIKALCGGTGEKRYSFGLNRATQSKLPPGSSLKPLSVYGPAMDVGLISQSTLVDDRADIVLNGTSWYPKNSGGGNNGVITIRTALINSLNTVAAQILDKLTPAVSYEYLTNRMGMNLSTFDEDYAPLAVGQLTNGITVREMAQAYSALANDGVMAYSRTYYKVTDAEGNVILDNTQTETSRVFKTNTARHITDMLQGAVQSGTGWSAYLGWGQNPVAGKTGTTTDDQDRWFVGYTPYYVCAVWTGYDMPAPMYYNDNPAAIIFKSVMQPVHSDLPVKSFASPTYWPGPTGVFGDLQVKPAEEETNNEDEVDYSGIVIPPVPVE